MYYLGEQGRVKLLSISKQGGDHEVPPHFGLNEDVPIAPPIVEGTLIYVFVLLG
jgi:hypothetical protein